MLTRFVRHLAVLCVIIMSLTLALTGGAAHAMGGGHGGGGHGGGHFGGGHFGGGRFGGGRFGGFPGFIDGGFFFDPFFSPYYYPYYAPYPVEPYPPDDEGWGEPPPEAGNEPRAERGPPAREEAERASYGLVQLRGVPDGAAVDLNGRFWLRAEGLDQRWLAIPYGEHTLTVRVRGSAPVERRVEVQSGKTSVVRFGPFRQEAG